MNTDDNVVKAWGRSGAGESGTKREGIWDIYDIVNNKK